MFRMARKRRPELCPVCRRAYTSMSFTKQGDMVYWHETTFIDRQAHRTGCIITDNSEIRGVSFSPDALDALDLDGGD